MLNTRFSSNLTDKNGVARRDFIKRAAVFAAGTGGILRSVRGADTKADAKFVMAETTFGRVRGQEVQGIKVFKGIPYGGNTGGANRFRPPTDPVKWTGVRDALEYGPSAPSKDPAAATGRAGALPEGEDCLVLNVWTPAVKDGRKRPVMFWCHGGAFVNGSGSDAGQDGTNLCHRGDVVVVTINHRINVLGFTYLAERGGPDFATSGDNGMLDIVHALKWVHDNIAEFGGDPNTVMIFGQSGGGRKVGTLLAMPSAKGLFHRAVIESGPTIKLVDKDQAIWVADQVLRKVGLNKTQVRELQKLPLEQVMGAYYGLMRSINVDMFTAGFSPTMDGKVVPQHPFHPTASAISSNVPVIVGCNRTEDTSFERDQAVFSLDKAGMREHVRDVIGSEAEPAYREALVDSLIDVYSKANPGASPSEIYFLIASDQKFVAPSMKIAERRADLGKAPVYLYYFRWETPVNGGRLKTPHGMEVPMVFDNVKISTRTTGGGPDAMALADKVSDAWIAFARTGNPNTPKLPNWPAFNSKDWPTMVFNNESKVEKDPIHEQRLAMFTATNLT